MSDKTHKQRLEKFKEKQGKKGPRKNKSLRPIPHEVCQQLVRFGQYVQRLKNVTSVTSHGQALPSHDIPYGPSHFVKGTQAPVLRLKMKQQIISTAAAAYTTVLPVDASVFSNFTDLAVVFDEYRCLRGEVKYFPVSQFTMTIAAVGNNTFGGAVIDYGNASAMTTFDDMNSHDTARYFGLCDTPGKERKHHEPAAVWDIQLEPLPDEEWLPTATSSTVFYWWKPYFSAAATLSSSFTAGYLLGWMDFQFRGIAT
jgi:hypothetical protein